MKTAREVAHAATHCEGEPGVSNRKHDGICDAVTAAITARDTERTASRGTAEPDECDNCGTPMDGEAAATSDVCWDCWRAAKEKSASRGTGEREAGRREISADELQRIVITARNAYKARPSDIGLDLAILCAAKEAMACVSVAASPIPVPDEVVRREVVEPPAPGDGERACRICGWPAPVGEACVTCGVDV
jgi:hypothetical protein